MNNYNYIDFRADIASQLAPGENLIWSDKPNTGIKFRPSDIFLIPFSIIWCGFSVFWTFMAMDASIYFALFGIPFILVGIMLLIGRFFVDALLRKKTVYGLTNKRLIQKSGLFSFNYKSIYLSELPGISYSEKADGSGNITFNFNLENFKNSTNVDKNSRSFPFTKIEFIANVRSVHSKINDAKSKLDWKQ